MPPQPSPQRHGWGDWHPGITESSQHFVHPRPYITAVRSERMGSVEICGMLQPMTVGQEPAITEALRAALVAVRDEASFADLLFLEQWERSPMPGAAAARRIVQLRRANPALAAAIRAEVKQGRPLTDRERAALVTD